jgi:ribosomal protein S18 acetylase RimI-like enzyme
MEEITVRRAAEVDLEALVPAYAGATADEATTAWVRAGGPVPEEAYAQYLTELLRGYLADAEVWIAERDGAVMGISLWRALDSVDPLESEAGKVATLAELTGLAVPRRAATALRTTQAAHPLRFPHLYLHLIAVVPEHRGAGAGGAMLQERLAAADTEQTPAYLEASTADSARLYKRCGFEEIGERIQLPEGGPLLIPMWRDPVGS